MIQITPSQYIQSHTVLSKMAHKYADTPVIVMGGELNDVREAAEGCVWLTDIFACLLIKVRPSSGLHDIRHLGLE